MIRAPFRTFAILAAALGGLYVLSRWLRTHRSEVKFGAGTPQLTYPVSGPDLPVDHERQPGVPPPSNDDYDDTYDRTDADSFPASDPPGGW